MNQPQEIKAKVLKSSRKVFVCLTEAGETIEANAKGNLLKDDAIVPGDQVFITSQDNAYYIHKLQERKNLISRRTIRENRIRPIVANVDLMIIMLSVSKPDFKRGLIDRYLVRSFQWNVSPCIVFNKMDDFKNDFDLLMEESRLKHLNIPCFEISALNPEYTPRFLTKGLSELKELIHGKRSVFLGQSGVGKSKLINALTDGKFQVNSGDISKAGKGAHTTTWSEIINFKTWELVDSPGIRTMSLQDIEKDELENYFPDLRQFSTKCQFSTCSHEPNNKGCFFYSDQVTPEIFSRLEAYLRIKEDIS